MAPKYMEQVRGDVDDDPAALDRYVERMVKKHGGRSPFPLEVYRSIVRIRPQYEKKMREMKDDITAAKDPGCLKWLAGEFDIIENRHREVLDQATNQSNSVSWEKVRLILLSIISQLNRCRRNSSNTFGTRKITKREVEEGL